jgi:hypothetical protein
MAKCVAKTMALKPCGRDAVDGEVLCKSHLASVKKFGDRSWPVFGGFVPATGKHDPAKNPVPSASVAALKAMGKAPTMTAIQEARLEGKDKPAKKKHLSRKHRALAVMVKEHSSKLPDAAARIQGEVAKTSKVAEAPAVPVSVAE